MRPTWETLSAIRESIYKAALAFGEYMEHSNGSRPEEYLAEKKDTAVWFLNCAFLELRIFLEAKGLPQLLDVVAADHRKAQEDFMRADPDPWGETPSSSWVNCLRQHVRAIDTVFGTPSASTITREIVDILHNAAYSLSDERCFQSPPKKESEVHDRMEAILRCVFRDLKRKPAIGKPIKNFEPDTGLPSVRTLIEYKFVETDDDVRRVSDQLLADTRGYVSKDWDQFLFAIYETRRLKHEDVWNEHLRLCGIADNTHAIVIPGEPAAASSPRTNPPRVT